MAIKNITTSNTFGEWIVTTQQLVAKYNYVEDTANLIYIKSDSVNAHSDSVNIYSTMVNVRSDSVNARSDSVNVRTNNINVISNSVNTRSDSVNARSDSVNAQTAIVLSTTSNILNYITTVYTTTNTVYNIANSAYLTTNAAFSHANSGFAKANGAFDKANGAYNQANVSFTHANGAFDKANGAFLTANGAFDKANGAFLTANGAFDTLNVILNTANTSNISTIYNTGTTSDTLRYVVFTQNTSGVFNKANISTVKFGFNENTGTVYVNSAQFIGNTSVKLPVGTTAQRPTGTPGDIRYNSDENKFEGYTTSWGSIGSGSVASGGGFANVIVVSANSSMNINDFYVITSNITLTLPSSPNSASIIGVSNMSGYANSYIDRNGSNIMGVADNMKIDVINASFSLIYTDSTRGWLVI